MEQKSGAKIRILIADEETILAQKLQEILTANGFDIRIVHDGESARKVALSWRPRFILYDLMLGGINALEFLKLSASDPDDALFPRPQVLVCSRHNNLANIRECVRLGAIDYISKPFAPEALLPRLALHMQAKRELTEYRDKILQDTENSLYFMHLTELTLREATKQQEAEDTLYNLTCLVSLSLKAVRVSVIKCDREGRRGSVIASSDRRDMNGLMIDLNRYPEINYVLNTDKTLAVDNMMADPTMHFITKITKSITFNAMLVTPIRLAGGSWGVVSVRMPETRKTISEFEIRWGQIVANVAAITILRDGELAHDVIPSAA